MDGRPVIALRLAHQRVLLPALLVGSLILGALGFSAYWRSPTRGLPYHDSFAQSKDEEWQAFGGTWELSDGSMRDDSNERGAKLFSGSRYWHNYSIEADVMVLNATGSASDVGFILRSNDEEEGVYAYIGYFAVLHKTRGLASTLTLGRAGHGIYGYNSPLQPDLQSSRWYHLKVLAYGCRLVATASLSSTATPTMVSMTDDDCIRSGRIGLQSSHSGQQSRAFEREHHGPHHGGGHQSQGGSHQNLEGHQHLRVLETLPEKQQQLAGRCHPDQSGQRQGQKIAGEALQEVAIVGPGPHQVNLGQEHLAESLRNQQKSVSQALGGFEFADLLELPVPAEHQRIQEEQQDSKEAVEKHPLREAHQFNHRPP